MKRSISRNSKFFGIGLLLLSRLAIAGEEDQPLRFNVACHSGGGGYLTQNLQIEVADNETLRLSLTRFSPVAPEMGLSFGGQTVKSAEVRFPLKNCMVRPLQNSGIPLVQCTTGIDRVEARVTHLDGHLETKILRHNFYISTAKHERTAISHSSSTLVVRVDNEDVNGFNLNSRECDPAIVKPKPPRRRIEF